MDSKLVVEWHKRQKGSLWLVVEEDLVSLAPEEKPKKWRQNQPRMKLHRQTHLGCSPEWSSSWSHTEFRAVGFRFNTLPMNPRQVHILYIYLCPKKKKMNNLCKSFYLCALPKIWKQKLAQMGATIEERLTKRVTHIFAMNPDSLLQQIDGERLSRFKGVSQIRYNTMHFNFFVSVFWVSF